MSTVAKAGGKEFPKAPVGTHIARCYQVIDLGHQQIEWKGDKKWQPKVLLTWELPNCLMTEGDKAGEPFSISNRYTLSVSDMSTLGPMLEAWRGKPFSIQEREGFDIKNVLGAYCLIGVVHNVEDNKTYANISAVMALPKGTEKPVPAYQDLYFNIDTDDVSILPDWLQKVVHKSQEYNNAPGRGVGERKDPKSFDDMEDDVPF